MLISVLSGYGDVALLVLRLVVGFIFLYHGFPKILKGKQMAESMGKPNMAMMLTVVGILETVAALGLILGFWTEIASIVIIVVMFGAIMMKTMQWKVAFSSMTTTGWEFDLILLASAIVLLLLGAGSISLDALYGFYP